MMRLGQFSFVIFLSMLPMFATASRAASGPIVLAELQEESIPAQDLAAPGPAAAPAAAAQANPDEGTWERVTPKPAPAEKSSPASEAAPGAQQAPGSPAPTATPAAAHGQPAEAEPPDVAPAIDVGSIATTPEISDSSLAPLIASAPTPARAASLRITEQQRLELEQGHTDDAIRELAHAISIDPSNSYAYFYLGRAYIARRDYVQAQTFFKRAEIGVAANSAWLGETYAFEGVCLEQAGKSADAVAEYQKALAASPGNLTARVGVTRLSAFMPASASVAAPVVESDQTAPDEAGEPPPADEAPDPPAPPSAPPPTAN
ncbi:tetratricopeptide repeat protein [Candidatus Binatus sp.]|uniref:tetratricopeptide repeat protein n=2 Tax=Candidatus Binatus sp. TaxID=2811406 RepID=UPI003C71FB8D